MNDQPSTAKLALKWGAITGVALIVFSTLLYVSGNEMNTGIASLVYIILAAGLVLSLRDFKQLNAGYLSYGEGLGLGSLTGAIAGFLSSTFSVIYTSFIDTTVMQRTVDRMREKLEEQGRMSDEQIDKLVDSMQAFQSPGFQFIIGLLWIVFVAFVFSLVIAAVLRRNKPVFE